MRQVLKPLLSFVLLSALLTGCANSVRHTDSEWPSSLPPKDYFVSYYLEDEENQEVCTLDEYLTWINRFYFGWEFYRRGWLQATNELVDSVHNPAHREAVRSRSLLVGKLVSSEWAKDRNHRFINTGHLSVWGNAIVNSMENQEQLSMLDKVLADIALLQSGQLQPSDIHERRYFDTVAFDDREF